MNLKILSIGRFTSNCPYKKIFDDYKKRIKFDVKLIEIKSLNLSIKKRLDFEKKQIIKNLNSFSEIIILDREGEKISSKYFSDFFKKKMIDGCKEIIFIIGGPNGIDKNLKKSYQSYSFGELTWPHILVRLMLVEQIYRSLSIIQNHPYHK